MTRSKKPHHSACVNCGAALVTYGSSRPRKYCDYKCRDVVYGKRASRDGTPRKPRKSTSEIKQGKLAYQRQRFAQHNIALHQAKLDRGACADCGMPITDRTAIVIEWDHPNKDDKSFTIAYEKGKRSLEAILAEVAKCDAVCANCHRYRTHDRQDWKHDTTEVEPDPTLFD